MTLPRATYRLQFRDGVDFDRAARLAPYLTKLGVSHLYASPLLQAVRGSTHGYDVTDHGRFDDSLGGMEGFLRLSAALKAQGLGLILDIVPNHMAASPDNPWWRDVLQHGRTSTYADYFDVDWTQPKLTVPVLGRSFGDALDADEFALGHDNDGLTWRYFDHVLPLAPSTWPLVFQNSGLSLPERGAFATWLSEAANSEQLDAHLQSMSGDHERLSLVHEAQPWRLVHWRAARDMLSYRRFFEIAGLVGVRVEEPRVFEDVHRLLFEMVEAGHVDGVRVDHVDGLADPTGYLNRLAQSLPRAVPIWVEKILARDETLPPDWRVAGTTGYEFADAVAAALTNPAALPELDRAYSDFTGEDHDYAGMIALAKQQVLERNLASELGMLVNLAGEALADDLSGRDWGPDSLRRAIIALLCAMPVYRTYLSNSAASDQDRTILAGATEAARTDPALDDPTIVDLLVGCLLDSNNEAAVSFRIRLQQVSGALMAKAVEDTVFYRFNRLISANEVGGDAGRPACTSDEFHARMGHRAKTQPAGLSATATHDTKRGEDARMRIAAISEAPAEWKASVELFDTLLARAAIPQIDANTRWLFYQALLGGWTEPPGKDLLSRISAFLNKATREAQIQTSWVKPDADYENNLAAFCGRALEDRPFLDVFAAAAARTIRIGERKSLVQLALKLTLPGIPDIYQGTEVVDLSFVDPDNRRSIDFDRLEDLVDQDWRQPPNLFDDLKMALLRFGLHLRRDHRDLLSGDYRAGPLPSNHGRLFAFVRESSSALLFVVADLSGAATAPRSVPPPREVRRYRLSASFPQAPGDGSTVDDISAALQLASVSVRLWEAR